MRNHVYAWLFPRVDIKIEHGSPRVTLAKCGHLFDNTAFEAVQVMEQAFGQTPTAWERMMPIWRQVRQETKPLMNGTVGWARTTDLRIHNPIPS
jgi:hypothetical protein